MALTMMDLPVGNVGHPHPLMHMVCYQLYRHNDCTKACKQMNLSEVVKSMSERDRHLMDTIFTEGLMIGHTSGSSEVDPKYLEQCKTVYTSYETIVSKVHSEIAAFKNFFENKTLEPLVMLLRTIFRRFPHLGPLMYSSFTAAAELALAKMTTESLSEWCQTFKSRRLYLDGSDNPASRDMQLLVKSRLVSAASALQMILEDMQADKKYDDFMVPDKATAASIIGRLGERVMKLRTDYNCYIESPPADTPEDGPRHFRITGPKDNREKVIKAMNDIVQRHRCSPSNAQNTNGSSGTINGGITALPSDNRAVQGRGTVFRERCTNNTNGNSDHFIVVLDEKFWVRRSQCGLVIGTNGATVRAIQELTHTVIQSPEKPREPPSLEEMACFRVTYRVPKDAGTDVYNQATRDQARQWVNKAIAYMIIYIQHTNQHSNTDVTALVDDHYALIENMTEEEKERLYEEVHVAQTALGQRDSSAGNDIRRNGRQTGQNGQAGSSNPPSLLQHQSPTSGSFFSDFRSQQSPHQQLQRQKQRQLMLQGGGQGQHGSTHSGHPESLMHCDFSLPELPMSPARSANCLDSRGRCASSSFADTWSLLPPGASSSERLSSSFRGNFDSSSSFRGDHIGHENLRQRCASGNFVYGAGSSHAFTGFSGNGAASAHGSSSRLMGAGTSNSMMEPQAVGFGATSAASEAEYLAPSQSRFYSLGASVGNGCGLYKSDEGSHENGLMAEAALESTFKHWTRSENIFLTQQQQQQQQLHGHQMPVQNGHHDFNSSRWLNYRNPNSISPPSHNSVLPSGILENPGELHLQAPGELCSNNGLREIPDMPSPSVLCPLMKDLSSDDHFGPPMSSYSSANGPWSVSAIGSERKQSIGETSDYADCKFSIMAMSTSTEGSSRKETSPDRELEMQDFAVQYTRATVEDDAKDCELKKGGKNAIICPQ